MLPTPASPRCGATERGDEMTDDSQTLNREQRRAQKVHPKSTARQDNLQTQRENQSGFLAEPPAPVAEGTKDAVAASTTQGPTNMTGPGTGGATETDERLPHHEGMHL